jgi:alpha-ketoglutarate-dependent taurine dioxygenase
VFTAEIVPTEGAATGWADMRAAYDALDDATRDRIADLQAFHSIEYSQGRAGYLPTKRTESGGYAGYGYNAGERPVPLRPLVKIHPDTGRPNLLVGRHAHAIVGMDPDESVELLDRLAEDACQPPRVHHHEWEAGDAVVWDNRRLMHRATPFDLTQPRRMWHTRIAGERDSELALNAG